MGGREKEGIRKGNEAIRERERRRKERGIMVKGVRTGTEQRGQTNTYLEKERQKGRNRNRQKI